ncbi:hypothetical protein S245_063417, partial [Arachis hypogaea]
CFMSLGSLVHKLSEVNLDWFGWVKLIHCIFNLISLSLQIGQVLVAILIYWSHS